MVFFLYILLSLPAWAQTEQPEDVEELLIEQLSEEFAEEVDLSDYSSQLRYYLSNPLDLNKASERELSDLLFLSPLQIAGIINHRQETGRFLSVLELQSVEGMDLQTVERLVPFVVVREGKGLSDLKWKQIADDSKHNLMLRYGRILEKQKGYTITDTTRSRYLGDANRYMLRYRFNFHNRIELAINAEKDAGEPFFDQAQQYGFDHYGISLHVKDVGPVQDMVLGDYAFQVGQGLVLWNGLSFGKGAMITSSARQGAGLRSYTSMNEYNYLRGLAARFKVRRFELTPFLSWRNLSGSREERADTMFISSISTSGLHRTPTELKNRNSIFQFATGLDLTYRYRRLKLGVVGVYTNYDGYIDPNNLPRNQYAFRDIETLNLGINYQYTFHNVYVFGETAYQWERGWATLNGIIASLHPKFSLFVNYRNYQRDYYTPFGQALGEGSSVANEEGLYAGGMFRLERKLEWTFYTDIFRFPWLRYRVDAPSSGMDVLSQLTYTWYKKGSLSLRYRYRLKKENSGLKEAKEEKILAQVLKHQLRLHFQYKLSKKWEIRTRVEVLSYEKDAKQEYGGLIYQDVFFKGLGTRLSANVRLAFFHTDSYNARLYAYENDVLYASSFPLYNGRGWRSYCNVRYGLSRKLEVWLRYSRTQYANVEQVGSALDSSEGSKRSDVRIQLRFRW